MFPTCGIGKLTEGLEAVSVEDLQLEGSEWPAV